MRNLLKKWTRELARDDGAAGLIAVSLVVIVAFTALMVFLNTFIGGRALDRVQETNSRQGRLASAFMAYYTADPSGVATAPNTLPCPDRDLDGLAETTCDGTSTNHRAGVLPWRTLGLSQADALDSYGNYFTYVVSADAKNVCARVTAGADYGGGSEFTGSLITQDDLELRLTTQAAGEGRQVPFAVISHGANGYGAITGSGSSIAAPAGADELVNDGNNPTVIYTGPQNDDPSDPFDDVVYAPANATLQELCVSLTPGGEMNAALSDNFESPGSTINSSRFATAGGADAPTQTRVNGNGVAAFTNENSYMSTASAYNFTPTVRPVYVSAIWTPGAGEDQAGFSIATRATPPPTATGGDLFTTGLTFRFDNRTGTTSSSGAGTSNTISIRDSAGAIPGTTGDATYNIISGEAYLLEVFDNGEDIWMRVTQQDDPLNTAMISGADTSDLTGEQRVVFINGRDDATIDEIVVGVPMLALELNGTSSYAASAASQNMFTATPRDVTIEAWINPDSYPTAGGASVIAAKWDDDAGASADQSYRLYLNAGEVHLQIGGLVGAAQTVETFDAPFSPPLNTWTHVAATYNSTTGAVRFFKNGELVSTHASNIVGTNGVNNATTPFSVGANYVNGSTFSDFFDGQISDVRVWQTARTTGQIRNCFQTRVPATHTDCATTNMVVNWRLDPTIGQGGLSGNADGDADIEAMATIGPGGVALGTDGIVVSGSYTPALAIFFRPFASDFCPAATIVNAYQCDFRSRVSSTSDGVSENPLSIPGNMTSLYVKVWGAGGGAYDVGSDESVGGSGGFSAALVERIGTSAIGGAQLDVVVGDAGTGSTSAASGGGGGGASGIQLISGMTTTTGLAAGGGGGASFSVTNNMIDILGILGLISINCDDDENTVDQCGIGASGGGATAGSAPVAQAPDPTSLCAGRSGGASVTFGASPANASRCSQGGQDPSGGDGGSGGGSMSGGGSEIGAGGAGATDVDVTGGIRIGGGGGGGGAYGGEAGGWANTLDNGFGGGGGAGLANASVTQNLRGEAGGAYAVAPTVCSGSATVTTQSGTLLFNITPAVSTLNWVVGCDLDGHTMNPNATIVSINTSANTVTVSHSTSGSPSTPSSGSVTGSGTITAGYITTAAGGDDDVHYNPSYYTGTNSTPGRGGVAGSVNGSPGAVVLLW